MPANILLLALLLLLGNNFLHRSLLLDGLIQRGDCLLLSLLTRYRATLCVLWGGLGGWLLLRSPCGATQFHEWSSGNLGP